MYPPHQQYRRIYFSSARGPSRRIRVADSGSVFDSNELYYSAHRFVHRPAAGPDIPIVLTSGLAWDETVEAFGVIDAAGFLQKPFRIAPLLDTVRGILGN